MKRFFLRQYYKLFTYEFRHDDYLHGKFKVKYTDGKISENMCYRNAKEYVEIFGGEVLDSF